MSHPAALLLDLDDTLVCDDEAVVAALFATCADSDCPAEDLFLAVWRRAHSFWQGPGTLGEQAGAIGVRPIEALMTEDIDGAKGFSGALEEYRQAVWTEAAAAVGSPGTEAPAELTARLRDEALARYRLLPGALDALAQLREHMPLALVTNGPLDLQREKLRRLGLEPLFEVIVISAEEGVAKPDPRIFQRALERLGVEAAGAVMVGNDRVEDVEGALAAGLDAVFLRTSGPGEGEPAPATSIGSVAELPSLLASRRP